jgi:hypothetical protein
MMDGENSALNGVLEKSIKVYYNDGISVNRIDGILQHVSTDFLVLDDFNKKTIVFITVKRIVRVELM